MSTPRISVGIVTWNEEPSIEGCLKSLQWVDEIVVIDAFSEDRTFEIAKSYTDKAYRHRWEGFSRQRNSLLEYVTGEWFLSMDADERSTPEFMQAVLLAVSSPGNVSAFKLPTRNVLLGREMKYGGWFPDQHIRLFRVSDFVGWSGDIHEIPIVNGPIGKLREGFLHFSHRDIASMLEKTIRYSEAEARWRYEAGFPKVTPWTLFRAMIRQFGYRGILTTGFRDGMEGWIEVIYQTFSNFITYARLWEMQRSETLAETYTRLDKEIGVLNGGT